MVQPGVVLAEAFRVERLLGEGAMGVVVAAMHVESDRMVALKFMLPQALAFPQARDRFMREGKILERFHGEHIPRVLDKGYLENGVPYFAMEFVDGIDLGKLVRQYGALSVQDAADYLIQAAIGLEEVHVAGVVHRDLKPGNLILTQRDDGSPLIKLLDFGLSKLLNEELDLSEPHVSHTQTTGTMGTPAYMSPEQARSAKYVDERADIWSLGAILFYLTTARLPFQASATAEAFAKLLYEEPMSAREVAPWIAPEIEDIITRCLRKESDARFQNTTEFIAALEPFGSGGRYRDAPTPRQTSVIIDGPRALDVHSVLQQRTAATFDSMAVALGKAVQPVNIVDFTTGPIPRTSDRKGTVLAVVVGMVVGACLIVLALLLLGGDSGEVDGQPNIEPAAADETSDTADADGSGAGASSENAGSEAGAATSGGDSAASASEASEGASDRTGDERAGEKGKASRSKAGRSRKKSSRRDRTGSSKSSDKPPDGADSGDGAKKPRRPPARRDPFGSIY